jgi:cell division protein FtsI/penicillin-binding protein 2
MVLRPVYVRVYPQGRLAGHLIGYSGKTGRNPDA